MGDEGAALPTCGGSGAASERGTAANALYACFTFMGNSSGEVGEGARGCRGVGGREGRKAGATRGRVRWTEERMDREMEEREEEQTMKENKKKNGTVEVDMVGGWVGLCKGAGLMPEEEWRRGASEKGPALYARAPHLRAAAS